MFSLEWSSDPDTAKPITPRVSLMHSGQINTICVFCGASTGKDPGYEKAARDLGKLMAKNGLHLVFGAGRIGMMGAVANAVIAGSGEAIGVIPQFLKDRELAHNNLTKLHVVNSMHERKRLMYELSDAFIILPGGLGTLDEAVEMITWSQLGRHNKPVVFINTDGYWTPFQILINQICESGFAHGDINAHYQMATDPIEAVNLLIR